MRSFLLYILVLLVVTLTSTSAPSDANVTKTVKKEMAITKFDHPVTLMTVPLKGEYLFVHDDAAMARGEACTRVYKGRSETPKDLVISFHCLPIVREEVETFTVRTLEVSPGQYELREFQFAYDKEGHLVPGNQHAAHVTITSVY